MDKIFKVIILFLLLFFSVGKLQAEIIEETVGNITNIRNSDDRIYQMEQLLNKLSPVQQANLLDKALANPASYEPIHYIALADSYFRTDKDKAVLTYMIGLLRSTQDIAMCEDMSARAQMGIYPMFAPKTTEYMQSMDQKTFEKLKQDTVNWDINHKNRVNPKWACYHGMAAFSGDVTIKPMSEYKETQKMITEYFLQMTNK